MNRDAANTDVKYNALARRYIALLDVYDCVRGALAKDEEFQACLAQK